MDLNPISGLPIDLQGTARHVVAVLADEFAGVVGLPTVERLVVESLHEVLPGDDLQSLGSQVETAARSVLNDAAVGETSDVPLPTLLFLCTHNAGRSQMAAGWARHLSGGRLHVASAGSAPGEHVNPNAVTAMAEVGIDISDQVPSPWTDLMVRSADVVVTMGCGEACPVVPGVRYLDWDVADPHDTDLDTVREIRDELRLLVSELLDAVGAQRH